MSAGALGRQQARTGWLFLAPALFLLVAVGFYPLLQTFLYSLTDARAGSLDTPRFVGPANFRELLADSLFLEAALTTLLFTISSVALEMVLGLAFALLVHGGFRGRGLMRGAMLIPWALPTVVAARMWAWMLNDQFGVVNDLLYRRAGLLEDPVAWTGTQGIALVSVVLVDVWKTTPFVALILLAGLQTIPGGLYEAANVDGARAWQRFLHVTLPLLKPALLVALVFRTLDALRVFDVVWVLTGGEFGTETLGTYAYRQILEYQRLGFGSAASVVIFVGIALFVVLYVTTIRVEDTP